MAVDKQTRAENLRSFLAEKWKVGKLARQLRDHRNSADRIVAEAGLLLRPSRPVAAYLRSATELRGESLQRQLEAVLRYARDHDMQVIRFYCDECGSGLRIDNRPGLAQLFRDVASDAADFDAVLLLDPSRWGRFPCAHDVIAEELARANSTVEIHYCFDPPDDAEEISASEMAEFLKRAMAREYGRGPYSDPARTG